MKTKLDLIIDLYIKLAKKKQGYPSRSELIKAGVSRDSIRSRFGTMEELRKQAEKKRPEVFKDFISPELFSQKAHKEMLSQLKGYNRFIVTTAVAGAAAYTPFLNSLKNFSKRNKSKILVIPANYALKEIDKNLFSDPEIELVTRAVKLNSNLYIDPIKIDPKQPDPATGLDALGKTEGTVIIGSPKQRRVPIANSNTKLASIIQATGAITRPNYIPRDGIPKRRDTLAHAHHVMGAVIVEIVNDKYFHFRPIEMCKDGSFNDLFYKYLPNGDKKYVGCKAIVQGDYHVLETDPQVDAAVDLMCSIGKPTYRFLHDFFSGVSINHHELHNKVARARLAQKGGISLEAELKENVKVIKEKLKLKTAKKLVFVKSNHDEFLDRYLAKGDFDDLNRMISTALQLEAMKGEDPFVAALKMFGLNDTKDIMFLKRDQDFRVGGNELGAHGDLGANGKRNPGIKGMYKAYGRVVYGHCHHGEIWHGAMSVGTSSYRKLDYNKGASNWDQSQGIIYEDGTRQLINVIEGRFTTFFDEKK